MNATRIRILRPATAFLFTMLVSQAFSYFRGYYFQKFSGSANQKICRFANKACVHGVHRKLLDETSTAFKNCDCLPDCNIVEYTFMRIESRMTSDSATRYIEVNGSIPIKGFVSIYFGSDEYNGFKRYASYNIVSLLSNIGGFLGLFLGISLFSFIEIIYFFTLRFFNDLWF